MNYEQKYKHALSLAKQVYDSTISEQQKENISIIFPELKESEDERMRNALFEHFGSYHSGSAITNDVVVEDVLAWLEKQGEKLPVGFYYVNSEGKKFYSDTFKYGDVILHVEKQGEQKSWSEEDELMIKDAIHWINEFQKSNRCKDENDMQNSVTCENWLKSLKPQNRWKPSEQNIKDLEWCADLIKDKMGVGFHRLQVLIDELKNL